MANTVVQTNSLITLNMDANAIAVGPAFALNNSPLLHARKIKWRSPGIAAATVKLQTAPRIDPATGQPPAAGSAAWVDCTLTPAGPGNVPPAVTQIPATAAAGELVSDYWMRANCTVAGGAVGQAIVLEGVQ